MSQWETKDIVVVASSVMSVVCTIVVQLLQHVFTARRERQKAVESIRRGLYQNVIVNLDTALSALADEEPQFKLADTALDRARKILEANPLDVSERFQSACGPFACKETFDEQMDAERHNTGEIEAIVKTLIRTRDRLVRISQRELKIRGLIGAHYYLVTDPLSAISRRIRREWRIFRASRMRTNNK